jgi:hypothetical protein
MSVERFFKMKPTWPLNSKTKLCPHFWARGSTGSFKKDAGFKVLPFGEVVHRGLKGIEGATRWGQRLGLRGVTLQLK